MTLVVIMSMLAVWRATHMLQEETGPRGIFQRLQAWIWSDPVRLGGLKDGLRCFYCTAVWLSILPAVLIEHSNVGYFIVYWLGISAGAVFVDLVHSKLEQ